MALNAAPAPTGALLRVALATTLVVLGFSTVNPLLAVDLQRRGLSASAIGVFATLPFATVALMVPWMPRVFARLGVVPAYRLGLLLEGAAIAGYALTEHYLAWCFWSLAGAVGAAAAWNGTEALIAYNAPPERRGRWTGLYQTALGAALAVGPLLPALVDALATGMVDRSWRALLWAAVAMFAAALLCVATPSVGRLSASRDGHSGGGLVAALRARPALAAIAFVGGVFEAGLGGISAAWGSQLGFSLAAATSLAGMLGIGSFLLQYPAGWLADHQPLPRVFAAAGTLLVCSAAVFAGSSHWPPAFWLATFLWGAVGGALYTLTMIRVAHDFAATSTVSGTAAMIIGYTAGAAAGPLVSGLLLDRVGALGQAAWLAALGALVMVAARVPQH